MVKNGENRNSQSVLRYYLGYVLEALEILQNKSQGQLIQVMVKTLKTKASDQQQVLY
jgi:hypothetical protein